MYCPTMASLIAKRKKNKLYYYVVDSARVQGRPRIVHQTYLGSAEKVAALLKERTAPLPGLGRLGYHRGRRAASITDVGRDGNADRRRRQLLAHSPAQRRLPGAAPSRRPPPAGGPTAPEDCCSHAQKTARAPQTSLARSNLHVKRHSDSMVNTGCRSAVFASRRERAANL